MLKTFAALVIALIVVAAAAGAYVWAQRPSPVMDGTRLDAQNFAQIEQGRYLVLAGDCASCHDNPLTHERFAGGKPIQTPFGVVLGANITPDEQTGIGRWSDAQFVTALREGKSPHGSLLYPAMPYPYYTKLTRQDALAIRAYLNTVTPVRHAVVADQLPFPVSIREGMLAWNALYFSSGAYIADVAKSPKWNRGAYLVLGPGHCGACHTAKTLLGGDEKARALQGGRLQGWFAPNITDNSITGLGRWSADDIVAYLKTGHNAKSAATGAMGETIKFSTSHLSDDDLAAIATYLKSIPGPSTAAPAPLEANDPRMRAGEAVYVDQCSACHGRDGAGVTALFPALAGSANVASSDPTSLIRILLHGGRSVSTAKEPTSPAMPAFGWKLNDDQAAAVLTYVRNSWGGAAAPVSPARVKDIRASQSARN